MSVDDNYQQLVRYKRNQKGRTYCAKWNVKHKLIYPNLDASEPVSFEDFMENGVLRKSITSESEVYSSGDDCGGGLGYRNGRLKGIDTIKYAFSIKLKDFLKMDNSYHSAEKIYERYVEVMKVLPKLLELKDQIHQSRNISNIMPCYVNINDKKLIDDFVQDLVRCGKDNILSVPQNNPGYFDITLYSH